MGQRYPYQKLLLQAHKIIAPMTTVEAHAWIMRFNRTVVAKAKCMFKYPITGRHCGVVFDEHKKRNITSHDFQEETD